MEWWEGKSQESEPQELCCAIAPTRKVREYTLTKSHQHDIRNNYSHGYLTWKIEIFWFPNLGKNCRQLSGKQEKHFSPSKNSPQPRVSYSMPKISSETTYIQRACGLCRMYLNTRQYMFVTTNKQRMI